MARRAADEETKMQRVLLAFLLLTAPACGGEIGTSDNRPVDESQGDESTGEKDGTPTPPTTELCDNGFDDDGNGQVDEGCPCEPGASQQCFPGPATTVIGGACQMGQQICRREGGGELSAGSWGPCDGASLPAREICSDGVDQDCDGSDPPCDIAALCDKQSPLFKTQSLSFPDPGGCPWGIGDNLNTCRCLAARTEQTASLALPPDTVLCDLQFNIPGTGMYYDDVLFVTFDDVILMAPFDQSTLQVFAQQDDFVLYKWADIRGKNLDYGNYCLGQSQGLGACTLPSTQTNGVMSLSIDPPMMLKLAALADKEQRYDFSVITVGDDDPALDCRHSPFDIQVTVRYVHK